jgi:hypothetical protein
MHRAEASQSHVVADEHVGPDDLCRREVHGGLACGTREPLVWPPPARRSADPRRRPAGWAKPRPPPESRPQAWSLVSREERKNLGAKLIASASATQPPRKRRAGSAAGRVHMARDFDAPLDNFADDS